MKNHHVKTVFQLETIADLKAAYETLLAENYASDAKLNVDGRADNPTKAGVTIWVYRPPSDAK